MQAMATAPAVPALLTPFAEKPATAQQSSSASAAPLASAKAGLVADPVTRFFTAPQFEALRRLSDLLLPPLGKSPGALEAGAPEFLDFLIGVSPADRQQLYRGGLDLLNARAAKQFGKAFAALDAKQADTIIRPLLVAVPWQYDPPKDLGSHFLAAVQDDVRTATRNSREWGAAAAAAGRRGSGAQQYFNVVDPVYKG